MKPVSKMTQGELAAYVQSHLQKKGIVVILAGGAAVAIYSHNQYVSKDRLAAYYHWGDRQSLFQASLVAQHHKIEIDEIKRWSVAEGKLTEFERVKSRLAR